MPVSAGPTTLARSKIRKTKVARHAYWQPWTGDWIYLPVDTVHGAQLTTTGEDGLPTRPRDAYEAKGLVPVEYMTDEEILAKLPVNWRAHAMQGADPEWATPQVAADVAPAPKQPVSRQKRLDAALAEADGDDGD